MTHVLFQHLCSNQADFHAAAAAHDPNQQRSGHAFKGFQELPAGDYFFSFIPASQKVNVRNGQSMVGCYGHCWFESTGAQTRCHGFSIEVSKSKSIFGNDCSEFDISLAPIFRFQCFWSLFWFCVCFLPQKGRNWSYFCQVLSMWTKTSVFAPWQVVGLHMDTLSAAVQLCLTPNPQTSCILEVRSLQKPTLVWMQ